MRRFALLAHSRTPIRSALVLLAATVGGCQNESLAVSSTDESGGINTLSDTDADSTGQGQTSGATGPSDETGVVATCADDTMNGDETDVDCGGSCDPCDAGRNCMVFEDCIDLVCEDGVCQAASCYDETQNGNEDGVDCGGSCPNDCNSTGDCTNDDECDPGEFCDDAGACQPSACDNAVKDSDETDVDCGGVDCPDCADGLGCKIANDCISDVCDLDTMLCAAPACDDNVQNGDESDNDCGGSCPPCPNSGSCNFNADCISQVCEDNNCSAPDCSDGVKNGNETDEDCGGSCDSCDQGEGCLVAGDCTTGVCDPDALVCAAAGCDDGVENGDETDLDCGGTCGATCIPGENCQDGGDCTQQVCEFGVCSLPDCTDNVQNGDETDLDCGGACGASCVPGEACVDMGDCVEGVCTANICAPAACDDLVENGDETDLDCGGSCGATCGTGQSCLGDDDCSNSVCTLNTCQAPSCSDDVMNGDEGGIDCQGSCPNPCDVGGEDVCNTFLLDSQLAPAIASPPGAGFYVVVWTSTPIANTPQDGAGNGSGVYGQLFDSAGDPLGAEFRVNTTLAGNQGNAAVAAYDTGFVVTWESPDAGSTGIFAKRYDQTGAVVTAEFAVNSTTSGPQRRPDVATDSAGAFVICYESNPVANYDVLCRRYSSAGVAQGGEITVNTTVVGDQQLPSVGRSTGGDWAVTWQGANDQDGSGIGIYMARFNSAGTSLQAETAVNQTTALNQSGPALAMNGAGNYVIAWSSDNQDGNSTAVVARRYNASGVAQGGEFVVNTFATGSQNNPSPALNANGDFMIAWVSANQDGNLTGVYAQRYDELGVAVGVEFRVNTTTALFQEDPDVTIRGADEPIVTYSSGSASDREVMIKRYQGDFPP